MIHHPQLDDPDSDSCIEADHSQSPADGGCKPEDEAEHAARPQKAPSDPLAWRVSGWCRDNQHACPDDMLAAYLRMHNATRRRLEEAAAAPEGAVHKLLLEGGARLLACKPMGGIGNYIAGVLSCFAMALATNRSLLLARPPRTPKDNGLARARARARSSQYALDALDARVSVCARESQIKCVCDCV